MPEFFVHFVIVRPERPQGKALPGIPISGMMGKFHTSEKIMPSQNPGSPKPLSHASSPNDQGDSSHSHPSTRRAQWLTGLGVLGVMVLMGGLGLGLALWTQPQRRARDLPQVLAAPDRIVETVARGADLVIWAKGDFPAGNDRLMNLLPESVPGERGDSGDRKNRPGQEKGEKGPLESEVVSGCRFMAIPQALNVGKSKEWALSRTFGQKYPNMGGWVRLTLQLESASPSENLPKLTEIVLPGPGAPGIRLVQKTGQLEWKQMGGRFLVSMGTSLGNSTQATHPTTDYGGTLAPDFLELRLGRIPPETPAWVAARGGKASHQAATALLGHLPDWNIKGADFPADPGVLGLWEEAGNLRAEWIFTEQAASDAWEKVLREAKLGPKWKWLKQGRVISLQREGARLWAP